jgi:SAM-dependent methyltransferase
MSGKYTKRSLQDELLDSPNVPARLLVQNLRELDFLNRKTGAHRVSMEGIKKLMHDKDRIYHIADLGCGSGDWLRYMAVWARKNGYKVKLTGVDKNKDAIRYLIESSESFPEIESFTGDYRKFLHHSEVDIFHCALFCHHLDDEELIELLGRMNKTAGTGFVINDLQRSRLAYYGAKLFTKLFRGSPLSKHDGPVSVLRGFKKKELETLLAEAGVTSYRIYSRPFFRFLVVGGSSFNEAEITA